MSVAKFLAGFLIGGTVGGLLGIILAPKSGEETRQMISDNTTELCKSTENSIKELQCKANDVMDELQQKGDELLKKVQDAIKKETKAKE